MKAIEIRYASQIKELEKLNKRLERAEKALAKKKATAEKLGVANWTADDHSEWLAQVETSESGWIINKKDIKMNGAWFDLFGAEREAEDAREQIQRAEKRFAKTEESLNSYYREIEQEADLRLKEELFKVEFEQEQKEWKKDGITLEGRYFGNTPQGKRFWIERNHGYTERSLHCFTLTINGQTVFTSGEFWRAYLEIKNS